MCHNLNVYFFQQTNFFFKKCFIPRTKVLQQVLWFKACLLCARSKKQRCGYAKASGPSELDTGTFFEESSLSGPGQTVSFSNGMGGRFPDRQNGPSSFVLYYLLHCIPIRVTLPLMCTLKNHLHQCIFSPRPNFDEQKKLRKAEIKHEIYNPVILPIWKLMKTNTQTGP